MGNPGPSDDSSFGRASVMEPEPIILCHEVLPVRDLDLPFRGGRAVSVKGQAA